ncbi:class I SAM-dependent methyltransferase [Dokdonella soli]|uniref:Methyltransferase domain-containing protein n=1 Tax=Dokdonella soli TaxID=529810 RepID=A0ABN1IVL3_9GAMM
MSHSTDPESRLEHSWRANAAAWSSAVREQRIASRRAGTDAAIIDAVVRTGARRVLDLGCGEGWLARALAARGREVVGIDASPELVSAARALGGGRFEIASYAGLAARTQAFGVFDAVACNFSLLGEDVQMPLRAAREALRSGGSLVVQTVHPWAACGNDPYVDGWRIETFETFGGKFNEPMPWYFRTLSSWLRDLRSNSFVIDEMIEPVDPASGRPLSLLLRCSPQDPNAIT